MKSAQSTFSNMLVESLARMPVPTVDHSTSVSQIAALMVKNNIGAVIVVRGNEPVGIVTEKDIIRKVIYANQNTKEVVAQEIMSSPLISISHDRLVDEALEIMDNNHVRRLVVLKGESMIGLLTERRLLRAKNSAKPNLLKQKQINHEP